MRGKKNRFNLYLYKQIKREKKKDVIQNQKISKKEIHIYKNNLLKKLCIKKI